MQTIGLQSDHLLLVGTRISDDFIEVNGTEFDAFSGLIIAGGLSHQSKVPVHELWTDSKYIPSIFSTVMSRDRFLDIMKHLRFDDKELRQAKMETDRIAAVREMYEIVVEKFKSSYKPSGCLTVDERISAFKGRVGFKIYMPNKPKKYGMKLWMLCDTENYYVSNFKIYAGKEGGKRKVDQGKNVVLELTRHLDSGHNVTTDNFFTSPSLAIELLRRSNPITLLGTCRKNRKNIPDFIRNHVKDEKEKKKREKKNLPRGMKRVTEEEFDYPSKFAYSSELQLVSYMYKKDKSIILLSSSSPNIDVSKEKKKKPGLVLDYNDTKYAVDKLDEMTASTSCTRGTRRWTVNLFFNILDMVCHNALVAFRLSDENEGRKKREFLEELSDKLCFPQTSSRVSNSRLRKNVKENIRKFVSPLSSQSSSSSSQVASQSSTNTKRERPGRDERCDLCPGATRKRNRGTNYCSSCVKKVCGEHQQPVKCLNCD